MIKLWRMMKTKTFFVAALILGIACACSAQTSSPTPAAPASPNASPTETTTLQLGPNPRTRSTRKAGAPYVEGPVWVLTMIKTKSGLSDDYLKSIAGTVKPVYEEEKERKIILDYKILSGDASGAQDFNILIMVEYPNMAALDGLREKTDSIIERVIGPEKERSEMAVKRLDIREILANKTMREIWLK